MTQIPVSDSLQVSMDTDFLTDKLQAGALAEAARAKIARADIELTAIAFAASDAALSD